MDQDNQHAPSQNVMQPQQARGLVLSAYSLILRLWCCVVVSGCSTYAHHDPATSGPTPLPIEAPSQEAIRAAVERGVSFLIKSQNKDGSWGKHNTVKEKIWCPIPSGHAALRAATSALCVSALLEAGSKQPNAEETLLRGEDWLLENLPKVTLCEPTLAFNNWAHAYGLQALVDMLNHATLDDKRRELVRMGILEQIRRLARYQTVDGGWCYYPSVPTTLPLIGSPTMCITAAVLFALHSATEAGFDIQRNKVIDRAIYGMRRGRRPDLSYGYGFDWPPMNDQSLPSASIGRSQACNAALYLWGCEEVTVPVMETWLKRLFARNGWLSMARKQQYPHQGYFGNAAYYYYFGHYYAAHCIDLLPESERPYYQDYLAFLLLPKQEKDGSWWDFALFQYHQQYGTAYAVMSLTRCLRPAKQ